MTPYEELALLLRPAAGGLYVVSTGREDRLPVQQRIYGGLNENQVADGWRAALGRARQARAFLIGIPSDTGAGFLRGASEGPAAIRVRLVTEEPEFYARATAKGLVDVGDVFTVPQLLHDDMLSEAQKSATRAAIYPGLAERERARLPVAPLSMAERAIHLLLQLNPEAALFVLGGDHACAGPAVRALSEVHPPPRLGVVHLDAHNDLQEERLGVRYGHACWAYHANQRLGRQGRLIQVGLRASRRGRSHWESMHDVRQLWADEARADPSGTIEEIVAQVHRAGLEAIYLSNDIDGTDPSEANATGTPEPGGLESSFIEALIQRLGREVHLVGGDVMEVAPPLGHGRGEPARTLDTAVRYLRALASAALGEAL